MGSRRCSSTRVNPAAGELVILAQANDQPLPFGLTVAGDKVAGEGTVYYQFALPLDRGAPQPPAAADVQ